MYLGADVDVGGWILGIDFGVDVATIQKYTIFFWLATNTLNVRTTTTILNYTYCLYYTKP